MRERWKAARWGQWNRPETVCLQGVGAGITLRVMFALKVKTLKPKNLCQLWCGVFCYLFFNFYLQISWTVWCPSRRAYWRMSQRVDVWSRLSPLPGGATGKPSMNSAFILHIRPETRASLSWAGWTFEKSEGRSEPFSRTILSDDLRYEVKS